MRTRGFQNLENFAAVINGWSLFCPLHDARCCLTLLFPISHSPLLPPPHLTTPWKGARGQEPGISRTIYLYNNSEGKKKTLLIDLADLLKCILYWTGFGSPRLTVVHMDLTNCKPVNDCVSKRRPLSDQLRPSQRGPANSYLVYEIGLRLPFPLLRSRKLGGASQCHAAQWVAWRTRDQTRIWPKQV